MIFSTETTPAIGVQHIKWAGQPAVSLKSPDGASAVVLLQGAHLVSWRRPDGQEQLFLSERALYAPGQAVRGGVPVIFPQFERLGPLPRHGFVRTTPWRVEHVSQSATDVLVVLGLNDSDATQAIWAHAFATELTIRFNANRLDIELAVINTGLAAFRFTAALHTYLRVQDIDRVGLEGLYRLRYRDNARGTEQVDPHQALQVSGEVDRTYFDAARELTLNDSVFRKRISAAGFHDVVVWNPGPEKCAALPDMLINGYREMLCVEAAAIGQPIELPAGEQWVGRQSIECLD